MWKIEVSVLRGGGGEGSFLLQFLFTITQFFGGGGEIWGAPGSRAGLENDTLLP